MITPAWIYPLSLLADTLVGDPRSSWHPVALIGRLIAWLESVLLVTSDSSLQKRLKGAVLVVTV